VTNQLTEPQVRKLLAVAMAYDNRKPGDMNVMAWTEAANRGRWSFDAALEAIHQHYATNTAFLMPGHITTIVRSSMRQPSPVAELEAATPAPLEVQERWSALIRERFALPTRMRERRERRAQRGSASDREARERARRELDAVRDRKEPPGDVVG
jgi:hypothetical protein